MKKTWFAVLAIPFACYGWACSSSSSGGTDPGADGGGNPGTDGGGNPSADGGGTNPGTDGGGNPGTDAGQPSGTNPITGIAAPAAVVTDVGGGGGYLDSVRYFNAKLYAGDPSINGTGDQYTIDVGNNTPTVFRAPSNGAAGIAVDTKLASLMTAQTLTADVVHLWGDGGTGLIANSWDAGAGPLKNFDAPNDLTMRKSDGTIYVTDPGYQNSATTNHLFRIGPNGAVRMVDECTDSCHPNGIALSPKEDFLFVSYTYDKGVQAVIKKFPVNADGTLGAATKFADAGLDVDALAIDDLGNVYATYHDGVAVYAPNGAKWGDIKLPGNVQPQSICFGAADRKTLYIGAQAAIYSVVVGVPGRTE
jgi:gluconolactonase